MPQTKLLLTHIFILAGMSLLFLTSACKKNEKVYTPVPFLTAKKWTTDTIIINPPATYNQLSANDQQSYRIAVGFFKNGLSTLSKIAGDD